MTYFYPSLLQAANNIKTNSWFDIKHYKNESYNKKRKKKTVNYSYVETIKIKLFPTENQKNIINKWMNNCVLLYNMTNLYLKTLLTNQNKKQLLNFYNLRKNMESTIRTICEFDNLNKHTADYVVKHCMEMYKSAISNHKSIDRFNIKDLNFNKRRYNMVIEPNSISKKYNAIFIKELGEMKTSLPLSNITQNSILQYDAIKKTYIIISPKNVNKTNIVEHNKKCGIDIGVRTFLTVYSKSDVYEIGTNTNKKIDKMNERLDKIKSSYDNMIINKKQYTKLWTKYSDKIINAIEDMHNKTAKFLLTNYEKIVIGKVSIKKMVSNLEGNLHETVKRRLLRLSHYKFRMKLKQMSVKYENNIIEHDEYLTSKNCSKCGKTNDNLRSNKIFDCVNCNLSIDRDINASINIYKNRILKRSNPLKLVDTRL
jgi:putative transposase